MILPILIFEVILIFSIFIFISKLNFKKLDIFIILFITVVARVVLFIIFPNFEHYGIHINVLYMIILTLAAKKKTNILLLSIFYAITTCIIYLLSGFSVGVIMRFAVGPIYVDYSVWWTVIYIVIGSCLSLTIAYITGILLYNKLYSFNESLKRRFANYLLFGAIITIGIFFINVFLHETLTDIAIFNAVYALLLTAFFLFQIFVIFAFTDSFQKEMTLAHKEELYKNIEDYADNIERMASKLRSFRHDNLNLMIGFQEYINANDIENIRIYFQQYMVAFKENLADADLHLLSLKNLKIPEIKSLFSFKLQSAQQLGIDVFINVDEDTGNVSGRNLIDLCRILGIVLDNAIEACEEVENATLKVDVYKNESNIQFVIINTCSPHLPTWVRLSEKGYSSKGEGRGTGLHTVSLLIEKNKNLFFNQNTDKGKFKFELRVDMD